MKYSKVQFSDGLFAIERKSLFMKPKYKDLKGDLWLSKNSHYIQDCIGTEEQVDKAIESLFVKIIKKEKIKF